MKLKEKDGFLLIMILAVIHGLIYTILVPPWQHYDEPNHFEYVWLIAKKDGISRPGEVDFDLNRHVMQSMAKHEFFNYLGYIPYLGEDGGEVYIQGISQLGSPPLYYLLVGIPLRLINLQDVTTQLYLVRLVSYLIYLLTVAIAWAVARVIAPENHPLRMLTPLIMALFPGYTDVMTSVNNDVGAVLLTSLFILGSLHLIVEGFSPSYLALIIVTAVAGLYTKSTAIASLLSTPFVLLFTFLRDKWQKIAWAAISGGLLLLALVVVKYDDAAWWYRSTAQITPTRIKHPQALVGDYSIFVDRSAGTTPNWMFPLFQPLSTRVIRNLKGKEVTMGAWMWADQETTATTPALSTNLGNFSQDVILDTQPGFFTFRALIPAEAGRIWITIPGSIKTQPSGVKVYYDGIILVEGVKDETITPEYLDAGGRFLKWNGERVPNLIRNGSAENPGLRFTPGLDQLGSKYLGDNTRPSLILTFLTDWQGAGFLYQITIVRIFRTFIANFGWGHVMLTAPHAYRYLAGICLLLTLGAGFRLIRKRKCINWAVVFIILFMIAVTGLAALVRSAIYLSQPRIFLPVGRYIYPVMIPVALIFGFGYLEIWRWLISLIERISKTIRRNKKGQESRQFYTHPDLPLFVIGGLLLILDILSVYSIAYYYYL